MSLSITKIDLDIDFIKAISKGLKDEIDNYDRIVFISSNRRLIRFIEKELEITDVLKIDFYTLEDFVKKLNFDFIDPPLICHSQLERDLFFLNLIKDNVKELYEKLGGSDSKVFLWAKRISKLFDDIDRHGLSENLENFKYTEALEPARDILERLKDLYKIYSENYNFGFNGKFFENALSIVKRDIFKKQYKDTLFIFAGFLFLTKTELEILKSISNLTRVLFFIHTDLLDRDKFNCHGEEYSFDSFKVSNDVIRLLCSEIPSCEIKEERQNKEQLRPNIDFYELPSLHFEASFIASKIKNLTKDIPDKDNPQNIGVVLPNSTILFPLINFIGKDSGIFLNITMGYPFYQTDFGLFLEYLFLVLIDLERRKNNTGNNEVATKILIKLLNTNILSLFVDDLLVKDIKNKIFKEAIATYCFDETDPFYTNILAPFLSAKNFKDLYTAFIKLFEQFDTQKLSEAVFTNQMIQFFYSQVVESFKRLKGEVSLDILLSYQIVKESIKDLTIPFEGHPLKGIQIMGMLEARALSFNYLFIPDVNEGILPSIDKIDPLLPEDIKRTIGLTSFKEKEQLMKYYFFRLIYSCKNVFILYRSANATKDKTSRSRFVEQLILLKELLEKDSSERDDICKRVNISLPPLSIESDYIKKDEEIDSYFKDLFKSKYVSPSLLDTYLSCPYKYYLKYIKKIPERISLEEELDARVLGILVHHILEKHFGRFINKQIDKDIYLSIKDDILNEISALPNNLEIEDIKKYLSGLSEFNIRALRLILEHRFKSFFSKTAQKFSPFKLLYVEEKLVCNELKIYGILDRIDELEDGSIRIVDYKTGVKFNFIKPKKIDTSILNKEYDKQVLEGIKGFIDSIQIPTYMLLAQNKFDDREIKAVIYKFSETQKLIEEKQLKDEELRNIKLIIKYLIEHMKNSRCIYALPSELCKYCEYNYFCKFC